MPGLRVSARRSRIADERRFWTSGFSRKGADVVGMAQANMDTDEPIKL
jgi:hypothetical protein